MPRGGSVAIPEPYNRKPSYPTYGQRAADEVLFAYRNWRPTMSGHPECDGLVTVARVATFGDLRDFRASCGVGLSIQWAHADTIPGQAWTGDEKRYPVEERDGPHGPELVQLLSVHRVGFFGVYDDPAVMYVAGFRNGVHVGVWITNRDGGIRRAVRLVDRIAASFEP
ncbi:MAG: hypothetical protein QM773_08465 [Hyphomonadaceae bacterium]